MFKSDHQHFSIRAQLVCTFDVKFVWMMEVLTLPVSVCLFIFVCVYLSLFVCLSMCARASVRVCVCARVRACVCLCMNGDEVRSATQLINNNFHLLCTSRHRLEFYLQLFFKYNNNNEHGGVRLPNYLITARVHADHASTALTIIVSD